MKKAIPVLSLTILTGLSACTQTTLTREPQLGIAWVESSAEYDALTLQAYQNAIRLLDELIADRSATALPGQEDMADLPTAVILDVDETSLSNVEFQVYIDGNFSHGIYSFMSKKDCRSAKRICINS